MQIKYPSALRAFDQMMNTAKGKRIVVFLDYDGTLSPIVADPDQAFMTDAVTDSKSNLFHDIVANYEL